MVDYGNGHSMALMKCEVKQNNNDLGRTKLALRTVISFVQC